MRMTFHYQSGLVGFHCLTHRRPTLKLVLGTSGPSCIKNRSGLFSDNRLTTAAEVNFYSPKWPPGIADVVRRVTEHAGKVG